VPARHPSALLLGLFVAVAATLIAAVSLPAAAQTAPPDFATMTAISPRCRDLNQSADVLISGRASRLSIEVRLYAPDSSLVTTSKMSTSSQNYSGSPFVINPTQSGEYEVRVTSGTATTSGFIEVPCQAPSLGYSPTCFVAGTPTRVTMTGRHFTRFDYGYLNYDVGGTESASQGRIPIDGHGVFSFTFSVTPSDRPHPGQANDLQKLSANATWSPCPPTTTTAPPDTVPDTTAPPATIPPPTTRPGATTTVVVTTTTSIVIPPITAGAALSVNPKVGPPGFVATVTGTGFPAGPVLLVWTPGIGTTQAVAGPDGSFKASALIFPKDRLGPRTLVATAGTTTANALFLVVAPSVEPSGGSDIAQINRTRRFIQR